MNVRSFPQLVASAARYFGPKPVLSVVGGGSSRDATWLDLRDAAWSLGARLVGEELQPTRVVVIVGLASPETVAAEIAVHCAGGIACPASAGLSVDALADLFRLLSPSHVVFTAGDADAVRSARARSGVDAREIPMDPVSPTPRGADAEPPDCLPARLDLAGPETPATLVLSAGTGGVRKLVALKHANLVGTGAAVAAAVGAGELDVWLPLGDLAHPFLRTTGLYAPLASCGLVVLPAADDTLATMWAVRPTLVTTLAGNLPALGQAVAAEVRTLAGFSGRMARWVLRDAIDPDGERGVGARVAGALRRGVVAAVGPAAVREVVGGSLRCVLAGWGPLDDTASRVLGALGVAVCGAYGLAEACGVVTLDRPAGEDVSRISRDRLLDGVQARVGPDGELLVAGPNVMFSYHLLSPNVNPALDAGWLKTGDHAAPANEGGARISGRLNG